MALIEPSARADAAMKLFNRDGTVGEAGGNAIRCVAKYLADSGFVTGPEVFVETDSGLRTLTVDTSFGQVQSVSVEMGRVDFSPAAVPCLLDCEKAVSIPAMISESCSFIWQPNVVI